MEEKYIKLKVPSQITYGVREELSLDEEIVIKEELYDKYVSEGRTSILKYGDDFLFLTKEEYNSITETLNFFKSNRNLFTEIKKEIENDSEDTKS